MEGTLAGQVAVVTGGTQGIGRATVAALCEAGAKVAILARTAGDVEAVAAEMCLCGREALAVPTDVTRPADVERAFATILQRFSAIDILVNNAGTGIRKRFDQMEPWEWDYLIDLNVKGLFSCIRAVLPHMQTRRQGCIINIASAAGRRGEPDLAVYSGTKGAVLAFSQALAGELQGQGIRVITICPGPVDVERIRRQRPTVDRAGWFIPDDVAHAVTFLASPLAAHYNGCVLDLFR